MANTYVKIASVTVGAGGAASMAFSSITSTYTDLIVKLSARTDRAGISQDVVGIAFNGLTTNLSMRYLQGDGTTASSASSASYIWTRADALTATASTFGNAEFYIPNYAGSTNKSLSVDGVSENNATEAYANIVAGLWSNTAAITSIQLTSVNTANFVQYSTATLYGISKS